jgi:hypothetical protein
MSFFRIIIVLTLSVVVVPNSAFPAGDSSLLPNSFAGWRLNNAAQNSANPAVADPLNAGVLKEYGFTDVTTATYTRDDGRQLTLKAARFEDASGAFGAYTFYRTPEMQPEEIGDQAASLGQRVLFFRGKILLDATFSKLSAMSAAELRELAEDLPKTSGTQGKLPDLVAYLPGQSFVSHSAKYIIGPLAFEKTVSEFPQSIVDFGKSPEIVLADYRVSNTDGRLMLIGYPTPQVAASELSRIDAAQQSQQLQPGPIATRRTGRILILVAGSLPADAAKTIASNVNYDADITWNQNTYHNPKDNVGRVVLGGIFLSAVLIGILLVSSVAFGGFRVAVKRLLPGKVFDRPDQVELIALHLSDPALESPKIDVKPSINVG